MFQTKTQPALLALLGSTKTDELLEKFQTAFDPPPHFWKIMLQILYNGYGCIYARRYEMHAQLHMTPSKFVLF